MKIAVTALGETIDSPVDRRFGRARYFILYNTENQHWSAWSNENNTAEAQGAGIQAGRKVIDMGAEAVITGHCGPRAFATLFAGNVTVYQEAHGSVKESIRKVLSGAVAPARKADVSSGFGSTRE